MIAINLEKKNFGVKHGLEVDNGKKKKTLQILINSHPKFEIFYLFLLEEGEVIQEKKNRKMFFILLFNSFRCLTLFLWIYFA